MTSPVEFVIFLFGRLSLIIAERSITSTTLALIKLVLAEAIEEKLWHVFSISFNVFY